MGRDDRSWEALESCFSMTQPSEEQLEQVRGATARLLPSLDLETVRESQVVEMVEGQVGFLVRDDPVLRGELQTAIDSFLLEGAPAPAARPASSKRKRPSASLKDFVVDDDASDEDYAAGDDEEDDEWDEDEDDEGDGEADGASRRTKTASKRPAAAAKSTKTNGGSGGGRWNKEEWSAAREKWSEPPPPSSATDASATATGAPGALSDDKLALALTLNPAGSTAKDLASVLGASKSDVNKALYRMHAAGKAIKSEGSEGAPRWTAAAGRGVAPAAAAPKVEGTAEPTVNRALGAATATETVAPTGSADARAVEGQICALSRARRCVVSEYRGKKMVSLREYYEKDGAWLPGKKGISLWYEQWSVLRSHVASTDAKIAEREAKGGAGDDDVVAELSANRRLTVGTFRGGVTVGVREFYQKDGTWLPGKKGISLSKEQWAEVRAHADAIERAMTA